MQFVDVVVVAGVAAAACVVVVVVVTAAAVVFVPHRPNLVHGHKTWRSQHPFKSKQHFFAVVRT